MCFACFLTRGSTAERSPDRPAFASQGRGWTKSASPRVDLPVRTIHAPVTERILRLSADRVSVGRRSLSQIGRLPRFLSKCGSPILANQDAEAARAGLRE